MNWFAFAVAVGAIVFLVRGCVRGYQCGWDDGMRISAGAHPGDVPMLFCKRVTCPACTPEPDLPTIAESDAGSIWMCIDCASAGRVGDDLELRLPTEGEYFELFMSPEWESVEMVRRVVLRRIERCRQPTP